MKRWEDLSNERREGVIGVLRSMRASELWWAKNSHPKAARLQSRDFAEALAAAIERLTEKP